MLLDRSTQLSRALGYPSQRSCDDVLDASQFKDPVAAGPEIDLLYNCCDCCAAAAIAAIPGRFGLGWAAILRSVSLPPTWARTRPADKHSIHERAPVTATAVSASEYSNLASFELNVRKDVVPRASSTLLAGYRHIELNEQIQGTTTVAGTATSNFSTEGYNRLDGFQVGGEVVSGGRAAGSAWWGMPRSECSAMGLPIPAPSVSSAPALAQPPRPAHNTAFMSEWGITAVWQINCHLSARVGYEGLLVDGVALASQQIVC